MRPANAFWPSSHLDYSSLVSRVKNINAALNLVTIEYHSRQLKVNTELLTTVNTFHHGMLLQFIGELQKPGLEFILRARLSRDMTGLETDLYDRCVRIRRNFEKRVLPDVEKGSSEANAIP